MKVFGSRAVRMQDQMRLRAWLPAAAFLLLLFALPLQVIAADKAAKSSADETKTFSPGLYAMTVTQAKTGLVVAQYWSQGDRMRVHITIAGHPLITIVNGPSYYILDPLTRVGVAIPRAQSAIDMDARLDRPFANEYQEIIDAGGELVRSEDFHGMKVDVFRVTDSNGRRTVWISQEERRLPVRFESYDRRSGLSGQLDYVNWIPGLPVSDAFFDPPSDYAIERFETYEAYMARARSEAIPPSPPLFKKQLHGPR